MRSLLSKFWLLLIVLLAISCAPADLPVPPLPSDSLLLMTPYVGEETEIRDTPPKPSRFIRNECSVLGWLAPEETILRFPVELRENPHLSLRLALEPWIPIESGSLKLRIEYLPDADDRGGNQSGQPGYTIFETSPEETPYLVYEWIDFDFDLGQYAPGTGQLVFSTEGRLAGNPEIDVMWGQPTVYYPDEKRHRNVLLIGVDTLRLDALSIYGGRDEITPNIAYLAQTGTFFTNNHSQAPLTGPSFASMLTGKYPSAVAPSVSAVLISEFATTLSEMLLDRAWSTSMVCGNPYLGSDHAGFTQGMESVWFRNNATPVDTVDQAINLLEINRGRDQFMFLHMMDPHFPYDPPFEFVETLCDPGYVGPYMTEFTDMAEWSLLTESPGEIEVQRVRELYDAEVADVDLAIGKLFDYLRSNEDMTNTLVILAADHGEEFFEHNRYGHGQSLYDELVRLPLIIWGEGFPAGKIIDTPVANTDIAPSILKFLGQPIPDDMVGVPLQDFADNPNPDSRILFGEGNLRYDHQMRYAIDCPYKCITDYFTGVSMLFDLEEDPYELHDIVDEYPEIAGRLTQESTLAMPPLVNMFVLLFIGDPTDAPSRFGGAVTVPGGFDSVNAAGLIDGDNYRTEDNTIFFDFSPEIDPAEPLKGIVIYPSDGGDTIEVTILPYGQTSQAIFYPYGSDVPEMSGHVEIRMSDLPWPNRIPVDARTRPAACYVLGIPGNPDNPAQEIEYTELDPETLEQLRALGYIN